MTKTFFALTDQMLISGRFVVNAISVGNMKLCFKSVATCQSVQPSSNDGLRIFSRAIFEIFLSFTNWIALLLIIFRALLAVSQHVFETSEKISRTSLCLQVEFLRTYSAGYKYQCVYVCFAYSTPQWKQKAIKGQFLRGLQ